MNIFDFASTLMNARIGKKQEKMGKSMISEAEELSAAYQRPTMETPESVQQSVAMAKARQYQNMPGSTVMQNQIDRATAEAMQTMKDVGVGAEAYGGIADIYGQKLGKESELFAQNLQYQDAAQQDYMTALEGLGDWEQMAWQWNEAEPYTQAQQKAALLEMMGRQAQWEGYKTKTGVWAEGFQNQSDELDQATQMLLATL